MADLSGEHRCCLLVSSTITPQGPQLHPMGPSRASKGCPKELLSGTWWGWPPGDGRSPQQPVNNRGWCEL